MVSKNGVEDAEELAHAGNDGDLCRLSGGDETMVGLGERQLAADRDEDRHEQGRADRSAAAGDAAPSPQPAAVAVERGEAGQGGG